MSSFINGPNSRGRTPLHEACELQKSRKMLQLLNDGANSVPDTEGREPKLAEVFVAIVRSKIQEDLKLIFEGSNLSARLHPQDRLHSMLPATTHHPELCSNF